MSMNNNPKMLCEGGQAFAYVEPIRGDLAPSICQEVIEQLKGIFGEVEIEPAGSTMKKGPDEECGDIDILIGLAPDQIEEAMEKIREGANGFGQDVLRFNGAANNIIAFSYPYQSEEGEKKAQIDLKFTGNFGWAKNFTYSPSSKESRFSGGVLETFLRCIASSIPYIGDDQEGRYADELVGDDDYPRNPDGTPGQYAGMVKAKWRYSLDPERGLLFVHKNRIGKRGLLSRYKVNRDEDILISNNYDESIKMIFGDAVTRQDLSSVENVISYLFSGKFPFATPERLEEIKNKTLEKLNYKVEDEVVNDFINEWDKYTGGNQLNEARCSSFSLKFKNLMNRMNNI